MSSTVDQLTRLQNRLTALTAVAVDLHAAARGIDIETVNHTASHYPNTPTGGSSSSSDISDPTCNAAARPKPPNPRTQLETARHTINALNEYLRWLNHMANIGNPNPNTRPETGQACRGGQTHQPTPNGKTCNLKSCAKPWPCNPDKPESWWDECHGIITPDNDRCPRCELHRNSWICRDCPTGQDVHTRPDKPLHGLCRACYDRRRRTQQDVGDLNT